MTEIIDKPDRPSEPVRGSAEIAMAILSWDPSLNKGYTFEQAYRDNNDHTRKARLAKALIESNIYPNPIHLVTDFVRGGTEVTPEIVSLEQDLKSHLLIHSASELKVDSPEARSLQDGVNSFIDSNEILKELRGIVPIHVMGALTSAFMFEAVGDKAKLEELRSYTTRSLLRPYLGDIRYQRPSGEPKNIGEILSSLPEKIFEDYSLSAYNIVRNYVVSEAMRLFANGEEEGFASLREIIFTQTPGIKRRLLEEINDEFREISQIQIPERFSQIVIDSNGRSVLDEDGNPLAFPNFRQKVTMHEFLKTKRKLLNGDTGATKTSCAFLCMEASGAKRVTIFGPPMARNTWPNEANLRFKPEENVEVFTISSEKQLDDPKIQTSNYLYISGHLMALAWKRPELMEKLVDKLVNERGTDGIILDESDEFRNKEASRSKTLLDIVQRVRDGSEGEKHAKIPIVALTATPLAKSLEDLDTTMAILYPEKFASPYEQKNGRTTFHKTVVNNPEIAYSLLFGEQLILQWTQKDMFKDVQDIEPEETTIQMTPAQRSIYDWVKSTFTNDNAAESLIQIQLLSMVLLNPELIKGFYRSKPEREEQVPAILSRDQQILKLEDIYDDYLAWWDKSDDSLRTPFSADWLAEHGYSEFLVQCFFDPTLSNGIDQLAGQVPYIARDWKRQESESGKYAFIRSFLLDHFKTNENGEIIPNQKVFIVSPFLREGFTRNLDELNESNNVKKDVIEKALADNTFSLFELIRGWLPKLPMNMTINIDGTKKFTRRDEAARKWREEGDEAAIIVATLKSVYESMNFAIQDTDRNKNIESSTVIFLGWPFGWDEFRQMCGRFVRPGQAKPVSIKVLSTEGTLDQGFESLVRRKFLLMQMALAGVKLDQEDRDFFEKTNKAVNLVLNEGISGQNFIRDILSRTQGKGSTEFTRALLGQEDEWVKTFYDEGKDEFRQVGHNAELIKNIIQEEDPQKILSVGAGTCLLARKYSDSNPQVPVDNVDILSSLMRFSKEKFSLPGKALIGNVSNLSELKDLNGEPTRIESESYDVIDCSFMLDLTSPQQDDSAEISERARAVVEMNNALKQDGRLILSFHRSAFEGEIGVDQYEAFYKFCQDLEKHFGFSVIPEKSGRTFATDINPPKRIGWIITARKTGSANLTNQNENVLNLISDNPARVSKFSQKKLEGKQTINDYPVFSPKEFEIYNPVTLQTTSQIGKSQREDKQDYDNKNSTYLAALSEAPRAAHQITFESLEAARPRRFQGVMNHIRSTMPGVDDSGIKDMLNEVIKRNNLNEYSDVWQGRYFARLTRLIDDVRGSNTAK